MYKTWILRNKFETNKTGSRNKNLHKRIAFTKEKNVNTLSRNNEKRSHNYEKDVIIRSSESCNDEINISLSTL